ILLTIFISHNVSTNTVESNISIFLFLQFVKGLGIKKTTDEAVFSKNSHFRNKKKTGSAFYLPTFCVLRLFTHRFQ
ncbi:hypothetical protein, partial [Hominenteromicrobium sp.]|uniref:hypothetical protein n=1 Tax=Hominenteromicrobium sp. TaxID=3073581 RepID=UPI003A957966